MKKLVSLVMMLVMMLAIAPLESQAQASKSSIKAAKTRAKELKKAGWNCEGPQTLESAFVEMANKETQGYRIVDGSGYGKDRKIASLIAQQDALKKASDSDTEGANSDNRDNTHTESEAGKVILSVIDYKIDLSETKLRPYLTIFRNDQGNKICECKIFFLIPLTIEEKIN